MMTKRQTKQRERFWNWFCPDVALRPTIPNRKITATKNIVTGLSTCFWCDLPMVGKKTKTKDHVIPKYLGGLRKVWSCKACNDDRSSISNLSIWSFDPKNNKKRFDKTRRTMSHLLQKFSVIIIRKLVGVEQEVCLAEIRSIDRENQN